ncbi:hypothetical protein [Cronobacter muytjensii]|uniref:hypothetical protein n=1 Tax=Cronobacter muytjensii TaxID=413501 RepID=UPI000AD6A814|nr:hypothetical protein [Cronobacter muytjensii]HCU2331875.1 hypothetical protein [Klebsiella aerogenes]
MSGLIVFIICIAISVLCYKKVSNRFRNKGQGKFRTLTLSLVISFVVFMVSIGIGAGIVSQDKSTDAKASTADSTEKTKSNVYKCDKFDAITQTRQGTKYDSGYYSDKGISIYYTISDNELISRMPIPGEEDSIYTAEFNKIAVDGSKKYGNSSSNYFVSVLNDNTIKVIDVEFNHNSTITQICSKQ